MGFDIFSVISLLGGLGLFLYGMKIMGEGLEKAAGDKLGKIIDALAGNLLKGVILGTAVTALIQSSSATTVMVIGFINAGIMTLKQAVGVIMGANIGTTVTSQIIRLADIDGGVWYMEMLKPSTLAPLCIIVGVVILMFFNKKRKTANVGEILAGFGILFVGLMSMEAAVSALKDLPQFEQAILAFSNPIVGVLAGLAITAILQSSSASIGILQAAAATGMVPFSAAVPIILGQNIGTCVTALLSSVGANKNAKRAAIIHLLFNVVGTSVFLIIFYATPIRGILPFWTENVTRGGIANFHTLFNVANMLLLLPFSGLLVKAANFIIPEKVKGDIIGTVLDERFLTTPAVAINISLKELIKMLKAAKENVIITYDMIRKGNTAKMGMVDDNENQIDEMEAKITQYLVKIVDQPLNEDESNLASSLFHVITDVERIGDHAYNIAEAVEGMVTHENTLSEKALAELHTMYLAVSEVVDLSIRAYEEKDVEAAKRIQPCEDIIDVLKETLRVRHVDRLTRRECSFRSGIFFLDVINNYERIADHCSNIGISAEQLYSHKEYDPHNYLKAVHQNPTAEYDELYQEYAQKYSV